MLAAGGIRIKVKSEQSNKNQRRTTHEHERKFQSAVFFLTASPNTDKQEFGNDRDFQKEKHCEQV